MKIREAQGFFRSLLIETEKKSHRKTYNIFLGILRSLEEKQLPEADQFLIEDELYRLNVAAIPEGKQHTYLSQRLKEFKKFLFDRFGFIAEGHYQEEYMSQGMIFGMLGGLIIGAISMPVGLAIGLAIGVGLGQKKDKEVEEQGLVLKTKPIKGPDFQTN
ncbi:MAG: hypothetical protein AAFR87_15805 [Bacteroidota bacterium]